MDATTMMFRSNREPDESEARAMYQNLYNLVEKTVVQQAKIDRWAPTGTDSFGTLSASSWSRGALPSQSTKSHIPLKNHLGDIRDARHILNNWW
jgi:hypothetical protein